ncbi:MAG TPA: hypothetical protein VFM05_02240, partial [Candidatus Saccharimonadales bacterium]|nr:hypothetical protein [Candidatus Saccharimonadales bacterium]
RANPASPYIPAGQLALGVAMRPRTVTKGDILAEKRPIVQVQMASDLRVPLIRALASSLVYPPAEDHRMWASPAAWARQVKTALHLGSSGEGTNRRIVEEAAGRFAGAIVLLPRR